MIIGFVDSITRETVKGWAADPEAPEKTIQVSIFVDGLLHKTIDAAVLRPDLAREPQRFGDGRHAFIYLFPAPLSTAQEHRITVIATETGRVLSGGDVLLHAARTAPLLRPILVTAAGRSGTTQMMNRLSQAREICAAERYPFETRLIAYYAAAYKVLAGEADFERSTHPDRLEGDGRLFGANPFGHASYAGNFANRDDFNAFFSGAVPATFSTAIRNLVQSYYALLARGRGKAEVRFFAEKNNNLDAYVRRFARLTFGPIREIILVRDPRDLLVSQLAYFREGDLERSIAQTDHAYNVLMELQRQKRTDTLFVRYEEMVLRPAETFRAVSDFLGTEVPEAGEDVREASVFREHATSASPAASVGRWRRDMAADLAKRCNADWAEFLTAFGYDVPERTPVA